MTHNISPQKSPLKRAISLGILFFVVFALSIELIARTEFVEGIFPYRSLGSFHHQFEIKWFRLQEYVEKNGGVDVIVLGSSQVNTGVDPDISVQTYYEITGRPLRSYNFGIDGMTVAPNASIARLLTEKYHPALLIYVTDMRDYVAGNGLGPERQLLADPWFRYQQGRYAPTGWLVDHSVALQRYFPFRHWMFADFYTERLSRFKGKYTNISASGYEPDHRIDLDADKLPSPADPKDLIQFEVFGNYRIAPSRLANLRSILEINQDKNIAIVVVEMPVHPTFYAYVGGEDIHEQFQQVISTFVSSHGGLFVPAETCNNIPLIGRSNRWHLNYLGAPAFSECIGEQIALFAEQEKIDLSSADRGTSK